MITNIKVNSDSFFGSGVIRQLLMHQQATSHWFWIWVAWERVKSGSTVRALDAIGPHIQHRVIVVPVIMLEHLLTKNVDSIVDYPLRDGKNL